MKVVNRICQILCIVCGLGALVLFFFPFAKYTAGSDTETVVGTVLAFGGKTKGVIGGKAFDMAVSAKILFCFILTALGFIMSVFSFKKKGLRYTVPVFALGDAIFMLVIALSSPYRFIDSSKLFEVTSDSYVAKVPFGEDYVKYTPYVLIVSILLFAFFVFAAAYLFIDDYIEVCESKGKKTIFARFCLFIRDYKSEIKKIVWPGMKDVTRNTLIVLIMCLLVGALIWLLDWGLGSLIKVILNVK